MKRILSTILLCLTLTSAVYAQNDNKTVKPDMTYSLNPRTYIIGGITIDGNGEYDGDQLIKLAGLEVGQTIMFPRVDDKISTAVRTLWDQRVFSDVSITADSIVGANIYLHIQLAPHPKLATVTYRGIKKGEREDLEDIFPLKEGSVISIDVVNRIKFVINKHFEDKGFKNVQTEVIQHVDPNDPQKVSLDINIDKNEKIKIHRIYINGASNPKMVRKLKKAMKKTRESKFSNLFKGGKKFKEDKYKEDKVALINRYNSWGYRDAYITRDSVVPFDEKHVDIHIDVEQGNKYYVRNIEWLGNSIYTTEALANTLALFKGDVYNQEHLNQKLIEDNNSIRNQYYNSGYVFNRIESVETQVVGDSIDLEIRIHEGKQATLNKVAILGNEFVFEDVIRRELRTKPGDLFSRDAIMRSLTDLGQMGLFDPEKLEPKIVPNETDGTVDITYQLETKSTDQVEFSMGYGTTGVTGRIALKFGNFAIGELFKKNTAKRKLLPQGEGQTVEIAAQTNGTYYQTYSLSFLDPWFGGKRPNQFSVGLFFSKQTDVNSNYYNSAYYNNYYNNFYGYGSTSGNYNYADFYDPDKYLISLGGSIGWGKRLRWPDDYFTFSVMATFQRYILKQWQYFIMSDGNCNDINFTFSLNRNSTDQPFYPKRGSDFSLSVALTPPYSLWDNKDYASMANNRASATYQREMKDKYRWIEYHKWKFRLKTYTALNNSNKCPVLMTRAEFGILGYYNRHKPSPFQTFYMGGDGMSGYSYGYATETIGLRGYDNGALTPAGAEGYAYSRMSLEVRYPFMLSSTSIYGLGFLEGGNAWTRTSKFNPFDMKRSAGFGLRLLLPMIGMFGIDWAYGFDKVYGSTSEAGSQFHFIIGQEF